MKLTFLKSPSSNLRNIFLSKEKDKMYIKKELLEYLEISSEENGQISVAVTEDGKIVLMNNSYYNNFRVTIPKIGNPYIFIKGALDIVPDDSIFTYTMETTNIGNRENVPYLLLEIEEDSKILGEEDLDKECESNKEENEPWNIRK